MQNISSLLSLPSDLNPVAGAKNGLAEGLQGPTQDGIGTFTNVLSSVIGTEAGVLQPAIAPADTLLANLVLQKLPDNGNPVPDSIVSTTPITPIKDLKTALAELMESLADIKGESLSPDQKLVTDRLMAQIKEIEQWVDETNATIIQLPAWFVNDILSNIQELQKSGVLSLPQQGVTPQVNTLSVLASDESEGQPDELVDGVKAPVSVAGETKYSRLESIFQNLVPVPQKDASSKSEQGLSDLLKSVQPSPEAKSGDVLIGNTAGLSTQVSNPVGDRGVTSLPVNSAFNQPGWGEEIGERIRWLVSHSLQTAELKLNPPHLGPIEVRVTVQGDQMNVMFTSHHAAVREALESAMPRLREMFGNNGLELTNVDISQHSFSDQRRTSSDGSGAHTYSTSAEESDELSAISEIQQRIYVSQGLVDYYA